MSIGAVKTDSSAVKAKEPADAFISDGTFRYPLGHPLYLTELVPNGTLVLNLTNSEFSEFRVSADRDFIISLYRHKEGARFKLFIYRSNADEINVSFDTTADVLSISGKVDGDVTVINVEIVKLNGILKPLVVDDIDDDVVSETETWSSKKIQDKLNEIVVIIQGRNSDAIALSKDIPFNGVSIGSYADGDTMQQGDTITQILTRFAQTSIPPTYIAPTFGITPNNTNVESGTLVTPTIVPTFTQHDAGALNRYLLELSIDSGVYTSLIDTVALQNYIQSQILVGDGAFLNYRATAYYDEGETKNDNLGIPYPATKILAGNIQDTLRYTGQRNAFYAADTQVNNPATSNEIRALAGSRLNPAAGTTFTISIPVGTTRVVFAYPATLRDVSTVKYVELGNAEVKDTFELININVEGANEYNAIPYKVYVYKPAVAYGGAATYNVTI